MSVPWQSWDKLGQTVRLKGSWKHLVTLQLKYQRGANIIESLESLESHQN